MRNKKNTKDTEEEILVGSTKNFRFKKSKNISINPPSATLHISNLVKEACYENIIKNYFSAYGRIEGIKYALFIQPFIDRFLFMEGGKNMCLLKMASIEESLNAMAHLHDTDLGGRYDMRFRPSVIRKIQISFTRSKI